MPNWKIDYTGLSRIKPLDKIFTGDELKGAGRFSANCLQTMYFQGSEKGTLKEAVLPLQAQISPVFAMTTFDYNGDGTQDLFLGGNINKARLRFGKYDANRGLLLRGDGKGRFRYITQQQSGFHLAGDVRSVLSFGNSLLFGINGQPIVSYKIQR